MDEPLLPRMTGYVQLEAARDHFVDQASESQPNSGLHFDQSLALIPGPGESNPRSRGTVEGGGR